MRWRCFPLVILLALAVVVPLHGGDIKIKVEKNIVYGKGDDVDLQLDLAMPAEGKGPFPAIICIHGGGWRAGKRQDFSALIEQLAKHNFVAVTVSYRFAPKYTFPAQIEDCKAAARFLRANAEKYAINPDRIGAVGASAGGHLACLMGAADASAGLEGKGGNPKQSSRVQAVVSYFGPTDFTSKNWSNFVETTFLIPFLGGTYEEKMDLYRKCSPIVYCTKDDPPFLFFHGTKDPLVGIDQSEKMVAKLKEVGVSAQLVTMEGDGHGWGGEKLVKTGEQTVRFFEEKLRK
jgi:acetyl esterase/lipase